MKKANLSLNTIVMAALALVVLVVLISIFASKINFTSQQTSNATSSVTQNKCESEYKLSECKRDCEAAGMRRTQGECALNMECCI